MVMFNLRQHLFLSVAVPLSLGMLACILAAIIPLYSNIHDWNDKTSDAIQAMNLAASTTRLSKLNENLQVTYDQLIHDLATIRNNTGLHLAGGQPVTTYFRPYYARVEVDTQANNVPTEDSLLGNYPTFAGCWLKNTTNYTAFVTTTPFLNELGLVDPLMKSIYKANKGSAAAGTNFYFKIMVGMESGLYRRYPYSIWPDTYVSSSEYCADQNAQLYGSVGYDPRCRPWYRQSADLALAGTATPTTVVFSPPYIDAASNNPTISASSPIYTPGTNSFLGVVNIDFNMAFIDGVVLQNKVSNSGYFFLMDNTGGIISHPDWDRAQSTLVNVRALESTFTNAIWNPLLSAPSTEAWLNPDTNQYVLRQYTQTSVTTPSAYLLYYENTYLGITVNSNTGYILVMVLPGDDLDADNSEALSSLNRILNPGTAALVIVLVFLFALLLLATHYIARYYSRALKDAALILQQAVKPDLKVQMSMREPVCYELNLLFKQFEPMLVAIRFGNASFYDNNFDKALLDYDMAEQLMTRQGNQKGLGKVYNNKGNVYLKKNEFGQAEHFYNKAIDMGRELLRECEKELALANEDLNAVLANDESGAIELGVLSAAALSGASSPGKPMKIAVQPAKPGSSANLTAGQTKEQQAMQRKQKLLAQRLDLLITLAKRQSNLGVLYKSRGDKKKAYDKLQEAMENHQAADDDLGMSRVASNLSQFYLEDGRVAEAQTIIQNTYTKLSSVSGSHAPDPLSLQYATMTLGLLCHKQKKLEDAVGWFQYTLQLQDQHSAVLDAAVQQTCFIQLEKIFRELRNENMASKYRKLHNHHVALKNVLFALDCSGSMAGGSIVRCRDSINDIISTHIEPEDRIGLITFNNQHKIVIPLTERGDNPQALAQFKNTVDHSTVPSGQTAFWDAVFGGITEFARISAAAEKRQDAAERMRNDWLIALTDGEDNSSLHTPSHVNRELKLRPINLIIITVGHSYDKAGIRSVIQTAKDLRKQGHHIEVGSDAISQAFESVAKMITAQLNVETL